MNDWELKLRIVLLGPPSGVDFGIQQGSGATYTTIQKQRSTTQDLTFEFVIKVKVDKGNQLHFIGPITQGKPDSKFVYIDIGTYCGQIESPWSRRLNVPLSGISVDTAKKLYFDTNLILEIEVQGTGKDSGPNCGTARPLNSWSLSITVYHSGEVNDLIDSLSKMNSLEITGLEGNNKITITMK